MANYVPSALATAQAMIGRKYNEAELRRKVRPAVALAVRNQDYATPNHVQLKTADNRPVDVMYLTRIAAGAATAKVAKHTGNKGDSNKVTLSWSRFVETFRISRKQADNNVVGWQQMLNNQIEQAVLNILDRMETAAMAYLVANRLQIAAPGTFGAGTWDATNFTLDVSAGNKARFVQFAKSFLQGRYHRGDYDMIADLTEYRELEYQAAQGASNSVNTSALFTGVNIVPTTDTILAAKTGGSAIIMPAGQFAGLVWNEKLNRRGLDAGENNVGVFGTMADPFGSGVNLDISVYQDRADESASGGNVQDVKDEWEITATIGWALPPIATANDSIVHVVTQL